MQRIIGGAAVSVAAAAGSAAAAVRAVLLSGVFLGLVQSVGVGVVVWAVHGLAGRYWAGLVLGAVLVFSAERWFP